MLHEPYKQIAQETLIPPQRATAKEVNWCMVDEVPNQSAHNAKCAFIHLRGFDDLLLHGAWATPYTHQAGILDPIGASHKACIVWPEGCGEHACTPRPMRGVDLKLVAEVSGLDVLVHDLLDNFNVPCGDDCLFFAWV